MKEVRREGPDWLQGDQEGDIYANNHALQQWYAEEHLWTSTHQNS